LGIRGKRGDAASAWTEGASGEGRNAVGLQWKL
jgi:hypothetical protein